MGGGNRATDRPQSWQLNRVRWEHAWTDRPGPHLGAANPQCKETDKGTAGGGQGSQAPCGKAPSSLADAIPDAQPPLPDVSSTVHKLMRSTSGSAGGTEHGGTDLTSPEKERRDMYSAPQLAGGLSGSRAAPEEEAERAERSQRALAGTPLRRCDKGVKRPGRDAGPGGRLRGTAGAVASWPAQGRPSLPSTPRREIGRRPHRRL